MLLFAPDLFSGLDVVSVGGGRADAAAVPDVAKSDNSLLWPVFLPDGRHYLFAVRAFGDERRGLYLGEADRRGMTPATPLLRTDSNGVLAPLPGQAFMALFTSEKGRAEVRRLDLRTMALERDARALPFPVGGRAPDQPMMLSASADVLAYAASSIPRGRRLEVYGRDGGRERRSADTGQDNWPRLSPDGERIAYQRVDWLRGNPDLWVDDLRRGTHTRVTTDKAPDIQPVWSPDGAQLVYSSGAPPGRAGPHALRIAAADGTGVARSIPCPTADYCEPSDWSRDGKRLLVTTLGETDANVWLVELGGAQPVASALLDTAHPERDARFSPDGRWIAYVSEEAGRSEVSVRQLAGVPRRLVVSPDGGDQPVWRRDGRELFYVDPQGRLRSATVSWRGGAPAFGLPALLPVPPVGFGHWNTQYDVSADGRQIFVLRFNDDPAPREIGIVVGWRRWLD
ncbi:MAG TPA: hypothetical protein VFP37_02135, partial [Steroidobacteraceae bacterium]|nr:hypothetical protein [Steroidobacteraceae bacterium]